MGKVKKPASGCKDNDQAKISTFFQKADKPKPKSLFTEHGQVPTNVNNRGLVPSKVIDKPVLISTEDDDDFKSSKTLKSSYFSKAAKVDIPLSKENRTASKHSDNASDDIASGKTIGHNAVTCIPETQILFTPPSLKGVSDKDTHDDIASDFGIIPDTPDDRVDGAVKPKRPLGRSFLLSVSEIKSNPLKKAKENLQAKLALKKKMSVARKGLIDVSVTFCANTGADSAVSKQGSLVSESSDKVLVTAEIAAQILPVVHTDAVRDGKTPTKLYSEGNSIKRMAQEGISPVSKRLSGENIEDKTSGEHDVGSVKKYLSFPCEVKSENTTNLTGKESDMSVTNVVTEDSVDNSTVVFKNATSLIGEHRLKDIQEKAQRRNMKEEQRRLKMKQELLEKKRVAVEENKRKSEKLRKYQLTGLTEESEKVEADVSIVDDDALDDILQELTSPSLLKSSKSTKPLPYCKTKTNFTKTKPASLKTADQETGNNNFVSNDWTKEDDDYFLKLGVDIGKKSERSVKSAAVEPKATDNAHVSDNIENDKSSSVNELGKLKKEDDDKEGINACVDFESDYYIENYVTPSKKPPEISRTQKQEVEIEEFNTQLPDDSLLCSEMEELSPFKKTSGKEHFVEGQSEAPCSQYGRHVVTGVEHACGKHEVMLKLLSQPGDVSRTCVLHGFWQDSHVQVGDTVHILAEFTDNICHITDQSGLLVINPDLLLSGTTVVSSVFCMRKSILKEKFKGCDSRNIQMLYGSIIHSVFQQMLKKKLTSADSIMDESTVILRQLSNLLEMYANNVTEDKVMEEIKSYIPQMVSWMDQYTCFGKSSSSKRPSDCDVQLTEVCDIEENMWTPRYGLKGKIDLTVNAKVSSNPGVTLLPLELKTGKPSYSVEHKGQVTLYSMMCADRRKDPQKGLLLYLKEPSMKIIPAEHLHQRGLIQLRNEMAYYISRQVLSTADDTGTKTFTLGRLPDPISNLRACQKCPQLINCAIYQRQVEQRSADSSGMSSLVTETLAHLKVDHVTYFIQWCLMLDLEAQMDQSKKTVADIWCKSALQRESAGLCLSSMQIIPDSCEDLGDDTVVLTFHRHKHSEKTTALSSVGIAVQDSVVVSRENPAWVAVCTGFVHSITSSEIQVLMERESLDRLKGLKDSTFRIDKCDSFSTAGILYTNVSRLMLDDSQSNKLRRLLIDKVKPEFINTLSKGNIEKVKAVFKTLNKPQKTAILKVLMCKDYVLIRGYPGTGKTSTIVALVKVLYELGLSVLLTSYTHSAVDNILLKLHKDGVPFLRIGRVSKFHSGIKQYSVEAMTRGITTTSDLENFFKAQKVIATSCLGINHQVFTQRKFDVCIVDEASQVLQPACLGPLFCSNRFVLVGDPKQLPPVVQCKEARELGMDESLFRRLDSQGATFDLNVQYRMNSEIMKISNILVYDGCLKCGSEAVSKQTLEIEQSNLTDSIVSKSPWMRDVFDGNLHKSVIVLDTRTLNAKHSAVKTGGYKNEKEAGIVTDIVSSLCRVGIHSADIGVIAPYRSQVIHIRDKLGQGHSGSEVEVNTVDQYQGRDKDVIIISFVMSSTGTTGKVGELLQDIRRLNVAVTRAKKKLILIGNTLTLGQYTHLKVLFELIDSKNQIVLG